MIESVAFVRGSSSPRREYGFGDDCMMLDFHAHLKRDRVRKQYLPDALLDDMAQNHIDMRVVSALEGKSIAHQNDAIADLVARHPQQLIGCATINPKEDDCVEEARRVAALREIRAFELDSLEHGYLPEAWPVIDEILDVAQEYGLVVKLFTGTGFRSMPGQWAHYTRRHPGVNFVLLHMGTNDFGYGCVDLVSQHDNLYVETSYQYELPILRKAFAILPAEKILFGSNYPTNITYVSINVFNVLNLPDETRGKLFHDNAWRLLDRTRARRG